MLNVHTQTSEQFPFMKPMKEEGLNFFQRFILGLGFVKNAIKEAEIKAFPAAQKDVLDTMTDDIEKKAEERAKQLLNDMLSPVDLHKIVTLDKNHGLVYIGGVKAEEGKLSNLKAEAEFFLQSELWQLIHETPKELAQRSMFVDGKDLVDLQKGKSILYSLSSQNNIVQIFKAYAPRKPMTPTP